MPIVRLTANKINLRSHSICILLTLLSYWCYPLQWLLTLSSLNRVVRYQHWLGERRHLTILVVALMGTFVLTLSVVVSSDGGRFPRLLVSDRWTGC